jgi:protein tyrosine/serine phosphatase
MYSPWHAIPVSRLIYLLELVNGVPKPVLVHCQHGQDRTGLVIAAYRVRIMGWSKDQSMNEALAFGYRNWLNYGLNKTWEELTP